MEDRLEEKNPKHLTEVLNALAVNNKYKFDNIFVIHNIGQNADVYAQYKSVINDTHCGIEIKRYSEYAYINCIKIRVGYDSLWDIVHKYKNPDTYSEDDCTRLIEQNLNDCDPVFDKLRQITDYLNGNYCNISPAIRYDKHNLEFCVSCAIPYLDNVDFGIQIYKTYINNLITLMDLLLLNIAIVADTESPYGVTNVINYPELTSDSIGSHNIIDTIQVSDSIYKYTKSGLTKIEINNEHSMYSIFNKSVKDRLNKTVLLNLCNISYAFKQLDEVSILDGVKLIKNNDTHEIILSLDTEYYVRINKVSAPEIYAKQFNIGKAVEDKFILNNRYQLRDILVLEITDYSIDLENIMEN